MRKSCFSLSEGFCEEKVFYEVWQYLSGATDLSLPAMLGNRALQRLGLTATGTVASFVTSKPSLSLSVALRKHLKSFVCVSGKQ